MVRVIMGAKGTGKTKQLIDMINHAADNEGGSVVCVEIGKKLVYDVSPKVRLVESSDFAADNFTFLKGFISGMYASNYDLTHVFIDSLCRIIPSEPGLAGSFLRHQQGEVYHHHQCRYRPGHRGHQGLFLIGPSHPPVL